MIKKQTIKKNNQVKLTFVQPYDATKPKTFVLGDFNEWQPKGKQLVKRSNGTTSVSITVEPGQRVRFRYCTEDGKWFNDEAADAYEPSEFGEDNSIVIV